MKTSETGGKGSRGEEKCAGLKDYRLFNLQQRDEGTEGLRP